MCHSFFFSHHEQMHTLSSQASVSVMGITDKALVAAEVAPQGTGNGSISNRPWRPSRCHAPEQTGLLAQQMELMMRNKRDHFTVVL